MQRMIVNLGQKDEFLHFDDGSSVCLKPSESYFYKGGEEVDYPELEQSRLMVWTGVDFSSLIETTIVANYHHWDVNEPIVPGSWKEEGF